MNNPRLAVATVLGGVALVLALINDLGIVSYLGIKPSITGITAFAFAIIAFLVAMRTGSIILSGFLTLQGISDASAAAIAGATIGVVFGGFVLLLGVVKIVITVRSMRRNKSMVRKEKVLGKTSGVSSIIAVAIVVVLIFVAALGTLYLTMPKYSPSSSCTTSASVPSVAPVRLSITKGAGSRSGAPGYAPDSITLVIGVNNTVTWTNDDSVAHTVTSSSAPNCGSFNSGNLNSGQTWTHAFTVPGTYQYYCKYHSWMTGTIVVVS